MAHDTQHFDLPSELWFKTIAFVLSDSIYAVCCPSSTAEEADLSWDRNAFGTLRLVSKSFSQTAIKVADLALAGRPWVKVDGIAPPVSGEECKPVDVDKDSAESNGELDNNLKLIYDRFKLINGIQSDQNAQHFFSQSGVSLLSAYYGYVQLIKNCKALFSHSAMFGIYPDVMTTEGVAFMSQQHLDLMEKIHVLFPTAFKNILSMLDVMTVPEMVEKLRRDVHKDWMFIASGLEIVYRCAQTVNRRGQWERLDTSTEFAEYLNDLYVVMKASAEFYSSELKDRGPGEFPAISNLPGVNVAIKLIVSSGHHHQALAGLVNSWA